MVCHAAAVGAALGGAGRPGVVPGGVFFVNAHRSLEHEQLRLLAACLEQAAATAAMPAAPIFVALLAATVNAAQSSGASSCQLPAARSLGSCTGP